MSNLRATPVRGQGLDSPAPSAAETRPVTFFVTFPVTKLGLDFSVVVAVHAP